MKMMIVVALALVAVASAVPAVSEVRQEYVEPVKILRSESSQQPEGSYAFSFETSNGINRDEVGEVKTVPDKDNKPQNVVVVRGSYSYPDKEGKPETITYYADENGYHADGPSVPKVAPSRR